MPDNAPFISVCIPAYKRPQYLLRALNSIAEQTFKDFEVIVTDDSPDDEDENICAAYSNKFHLTYERNFPACGTPANWNKAISLAKGEWIKLLHDDDWFASPGALQHFATACQSKVPFIFSGYNNVFENKSAIEQVGITDLWKKLVLTEPNVLLAKNVIGPPSVTLINRSEKERYDEQLKWRVDMEYYIRLIKKNEKFHYIDEPLINVGISESQVTEDCLYNPSVELPEGLRLLEKHGTKCLRNILVYDAWWRLLRNLEIKKVIDLENYTPGKNWPPVIKQMIKHLAKVPSFLLNKGITSKSFMSFSYLANRFK